MEFNQIKQLLHNKGNKQQSKGTTDTWEQISANY